MNKQITLIGPVLILIVVLLPVNVGFVGPEETADALVSIDPRTSRVPTTHVRKVLDKDLEDPAPTKELRGTRRRSHETSADHDSIEGAQIPTIVSDVPTTTKDRFLKLIAQSMRSMSDDVKRVVRAQNRKVIAPVVVRGMSALINETSALTGVVARVANSISLLTDDLLSMNRKDDNLREQTMEFMRNITNIVTEFANNQHKLGGSILDAFRLASRGSRGDRGNHNGSGELKSVVQLLDEHSDLVAGADHETKPTEWSQTVEGVAEVTHQKPNGGRPTVAEVTPTAMPKSRGFVEMISTRKGRSSEVGGATEATNQTPESWRRPGTDQVQAGPAVMPSLNSNDYYEEQIFERRKKRQVSIVDFVSKAQTTGDGIDHTFYAVVSKFTITPPKVTVASARSVYTLSNYLFRGGREPAEIYFSLTASLPDEAINQLALHIRKEELWHQSTTVGVLYRPEFATKIWQSNCGVKDGALFALEKESGNCLPVYDIDYFDVYRVDLTTTAGVEYTLGKGTIRFGTPVNYHAVVIENFSFNPSVLLCKDRKCAVTTDACLHAIDGHAFDSTFGSRRGYILNTTGCVLDFELARTELAMMKMLLRKGFLAIYNYKENFPKDLLGSLEVEVTAVRPRPVPVKGTIELDGVTYSIALRCSASLDCLRFSALKELFVELTPPPEKPHAHSFVHSVLDGLLTVWGYTPTGMLVNSQFQTVTETAHTVVGSSISALDNLLTVVGFFEKAFTELYSAVRNDGLEGLCTQLLSTLASVLLLLIRHALLELVTIMGLWSVLGATAAGSFILSVHLKYRCNVLTIVVSVVGILIFVLITDG